ncbi:MAG: hypothetical protein FWG63_08650 [Defluviitaleaceae bacterium]|nr:hypothetical protein [Defluviitaleaceae bacterium]
MAKIQIGSLDDGVIVEEKTGFKESGRHEIELEHGYLAVVQDTDKEFGFITENKTVRIQRVWAIKKEPFNILWGVCDTVIDGKKGGANGVFTLSVLDGYEKDLIKERKNPADTTKITTEDIKQQIKNACYAEISKQLGTYKEVNKEEEEQLLKSNLYPIISNYRFALKAVTINDTIAYPGEV